MHKGSREGSATGVPGWRGGAGRLRRGRSVELPQHVGALVAVQGEGTQMIKGTERLISEGRLKGLNIYIAWLRAVRGETN